MRQKILHVVPGLRYGSAARQAALLAAGLDHTRFDARVVSLTGGGPATDELIDAGTAVTTLGGRGRIDPRPVWELRRLLADFKPDVIHAWQPAAVRAVRMAAWTGTSPFRLVVSRPLTRACGPIVARLDAWMLRGADCIAVTGGEESDRCTRAGVLPEQLRRVRAGVRLSATIPAATRMEGETPRYIACVGPIEAHKCLKNAVWAFDVLHYIYKDLHLLLIGTGTEELELRQFARAVGVGDRVRFLGDRADLAELFTMSELVWVPGRSGGAGAIMEAMAAGRPIIASRLPESMELLGDGAAGILIPPDDPAELARQTRRLLDDPGLRERMSQAGRNRAAREFDAQDMVRDYEMLYEDLRQNRTRQLARAS